MPRRRREAGDPGSHHGFLDTLEDGKGRGKEKRKSPKDDPLDLDRIL